MSGNNSNLGEGITEGKQFGFYCVSRALKCREYHLLSSTSSAWRCRYIHQLWHLRTLSFPPPSSYHPITKSSFSLGCGRVKGGWQQEVEGRYVEGWEAWKQGKPSEETIHQPQCGLYKSIRACVPVTKANLYELRHRSLWLSEVPPPLSLHLRPSNPLETTPLFVSLPLSHIAKS